MIRDSKLVNCLFFNYSLNGNIENKYILNNLNAKKCVTDGRTDNNWTGSNDAHTCMLDVS